MYEYHLLILMLVLVTLKQFSLFTVVQIATANEYKVTVPY